MQAKNNNEESTKIYRNGKPGWFWPVLLLLLVLGWLWFYIQCCSGIYGGSQEACEDGCKKECCEKVDEPKKAEHHEVDEHTATMEGNMDSTHQADMDSSSLEH